jgi:rhamnosyl/mannosyltransferase
MLLAVAVLPPRAPLVITHHSDVIRQKFLGLALRPFEHWVYRRAACVLMDSPHYGEGSPLLQNYEQKLQVLPLGIDLEPYLNPRPAAREYAAVYRQQWGQPLWLSVGRLVYYKGLQNAIRALPLVAGRLMIVGEGPRQQELQQLATQVGVADRVLWMGKLTPDQLIGAYHAATALWFPSNARSEGFGLVQVEAMACGCPVINSSIPASGVAWVSLNEQTGLTTPVDDPGALAAAANRIAASAAWRDLLGQQARDRARREFDDRIMARRSLEHYRNLLSSQDGVPLRSDRGLA